jgi:cyclopropane-fatty-acyl-phospholipid synthase
MIRYGIRSLLRQRLDEIYANDGLSLAGRQAAFLDTMRQSAIALTPDEANTQHYDVPAAFFQNVLGPQMKYSSGYWPPGVETLAQAEEASLRETCAHADLHDGQSVLELGCGWGSLTLWMARRFPHSDITAVSNSRTQKAFIDSQARQQGLRNLRVLTRDMNVFDTDPAHFDRVVSVEMFEHMRNWALLFSRIARWLKPDGRFFMHIFVNRSLPYSFEVKDSTDWMGQHFFSGGMMPSDELPLACAGPLTLVRRWRWDGTHYQRTAEAWLANMSARRETLLPLLALVYGPRHAQRWWVRWRVFFMACAELFGYREGREWWVSHYLFENSSGTRKAL